MNENPYKKAVLKDRAGDLDKEWYIEYYAYSSKAGCLQRKRIKVPVIYRTSKERRDWAAKQIRIINNLLAKGYHFAPPKTKPADSAKSELTINQVFELAIIKAQSLRKKSQSTYKVSLDKFRDWLGPDAEKGMEMITRLKVSEYTDFLLANDLSSVTINNQLNFIRIMIGKVLKAGYISSNPFQYEKLTETDSFSNVAFTPNHQELVENYLKENDYPLYLFTRIMYYSFIRPKEILNLQIRDFDFRSNNLTVHGRVSKNRKTRTIPLHPRLIELLKDYKEYPTKFYICGKHFKPGFRQLGENTAYEAHKTALKALGLYEGYEYTLYSWRHTGAINSYMAGTDIKTLQFLFRHSSVIYTEIYLKSLKLQLMDIKFKNW